MRIATWNVNSIKARRDRVIAWLERRAPDVVCVQETKVSDDLFPHDAFEPLGYRCVVHGQKTYNGVAILARDELEHPSCGLGDGIDDAQARLVCATVGGIHVVSAYFPNGERVGSDKYTYKLQWMQRLRDWLDRHYDPSQPIALCGDFNVAPDDDDVARPEEWANTVLCHEDVRAALERIRAFGFVDAFRKHHPEGGIYSWWDYQMLSFPKNNGLRIDHVFMTESLAGRSVDAYVDRDERKGKKPSDHAPVVVELQ